LKDRDINADEEFLQNIKSLLLEQGKAVYDANDKMAEKLSRIITEKEIARHKRLRQQIGNIKELIFDLMNEEVNCGITIDEGVEIKMIMERKLQFEQKKTITSVKQPVAASEKIADPERFSRIINTTHVDKKRLWQKVEQALKEKQTATLKEIIELQPLENGIAEVVSYFSFLRDKANRVQVIHNTSEHIPLNEAATKFVEVPYLLFSK
jgi:hypothetical protein